MNSVNIYLLEVNNKTLEKWVKEVDNKNKGNNKNTKTTSMTSFWCFYCYFKHASTLF